MLNFGTIKSKMLNKITESYTTDNLGAVKDLIKQVKSNKDLVEMYLFYEDVENKHIESKEVAKLFVEQVESLLVQKNEKITSICKELYESLKDVKVESNAIYESLDILSEGSSLLNIDKKVIAKQNLIEYLIKSKTNNVSESSSHMDNQKLLNTVLVNNFNTKFTDFMNEEQKETFKKLISIPESELISEMTTLRDDLNNKVDSMIKESVDSELIEKLNKVKQDVNSSDVTKYNYYRLCELKTGLN